MGRRGTDRRASTSGGLGLGLSLVRELVLLHGGDVRALSQGPGHGSEFIVSLPLVAVAEIQPEESARLVAVGQPVTVLVADDNVDAAEILAPGDWVHVSPGVAHWHGAVPDEVFTHLAVTASGPTRWLHAVDDDTYTASLPDAG